MVPFLNIDAGESDAEPAELYGVAHAVNVACGGHAGDARSMDRVVAACLEASTRVGAHPAYPDREGFGRRTMELAPALLGDALRAQCAELARIAARRGVEVALVKAHGALYHDANRSPELAEVLLAAAAEELGAAVVVLGPDRGCLRDAAERRGLGFAREGFADRGVRADGTLIPRGEPGAVVDDPRRACETARALAASGRYDTLCVHGDTPSALPIARAVRSLLDAMPSSS